MQDGGFLYTAGMFIEHRRKCIHYNSLCGLLWADSSDAESPEDNKRTDAILKWK